MKRLLYTTIVLGSLGLVILAAYFLRYRAEGPTSPVAGGLPQIPALPPPAQPVAPGAPAEAPPAEVARPGEQKFGVISQNPVLNFFVDENNEAVLVQPDGQIVRVARGETSVLSSSAINNLRGAEFSYDGKKILAAFGSPQNLQHSIFDVQNRVWNPLPAGIGSPAWSPVNYKIAYFRENNGVKVLEALDFSDESARPQELLRIRAEDMRLIWLAENQIILADKGSAFYSGSMLILNLQTSRLTQFGEMLGLEYLWGKEIGMGLVLTADSSRRGGRLTIYDTAGNALTGLSFLTMPSKCAFAKAVGEDEQGMDFLYCAVPAEREILERHTLPDDYQKGAFFTQDNFYGINLIDGSVSEVFSGRFVDADNLKVFGDNLFFINRLDGRLYAISLGE